MPATSLASVRGTSLAVRQERRERYPHSCSHRSSERRRTMTNVTSRLLSPVFGPPTCSMSARRWQGIAPNRNRAGRPSEYRERLRTFAQAQGISVQYSSDIAPGARHLQRRSHHPASRPVASGRVSTLAHELAHECCIGAIAAAARHVESAKPKRRPPRSWFATLSGLKPVRLHATTSSCGTGCPAPYESLGYVRHAASQMLTALRMRER